MITDQHPRSRLTQVMAWCTAAAVAGVCCLVLPPYLAKAGLGKPAYGWPAIPWFAVAWANVRFATSMVCYLALGLVLGNAQPRRWLLLAGFSIIASPVLLFVNMVHDWSHDATSHNLFPFEFAIYAFMSAPVWVGGLLGFLSRRWLWQASSP